MLTRNYQQGRSGTEAADQLARYHDQKKSWVDFCLFPDILEPTRMPSVFPIATHLFKRQAIFNVGLTAGEAGWNIRMLWNPLGNGQVGPGNFPGGLHLRKVNTASVAYNTFDVLNGGAALTNISSPAVAGDVTAVQNNWLPTISNEVAHGGIRLVGAFVEIEYIGTAEMHSGTIEVAFHPHARDSADDLGSLHFANDSEIIQMPFYKRYKPIDGARCVWFPIDGNDFNFFSAGFETNNGPAAPPQRAVTGQWCINVNSLQPSQNLRVHICNVYESIPDEGSHDLFSPKKDASGLSLEAAKQAINAIVGAGGATTPAKSGQGWSTMFDGIKGALTSAGSLYGLYQSVMPMIAKGMF